MRSSISLGRMALQLCICTICVRLQRNSSGWSCNGGTNVTARWRIRKRPFYNNCASCHGRDGKGNGPLGQVLSIRPADLTIIAKRTGGKFPAEKIGC